MNRLRAEYNLLRRWSAEDWMYVCLLVGLMTCARMGGADAPIPVPTHSGIAHWAELEWRVTMGNLLTLIGIVWWVGRWGAKQVFLLDKLPTLLGELERRIELIEDHGCSRVKEHATVLRALDQRGVGKDDDGD